MLGTFATFDQILGRLIASLRGMLGLSQAQFARQCRMRPRTVSRIEAGATGASAAHLVLIDRAFVRLLPHFDRGDLVDCVEAVIFDYTGREGRVFVKASQGSSEGLRQLSELELGPFVRRVVGEEALAARMAELEDESLVDLADGWY
jgi:transcriptional regulator with XRE-family HTH domain